MLPGTLPLCNIIEREGSFVVLLAAAVRRLVFTVAAAVPPAVHDEVLQLEAPQKLRLPKALIQGRDLLPGCKQSRVIQRSGLVAANAAAK